MGEANWSRIMVKYGHFREKTKEREKQKLTSRLCEYMNQEKKQTDEFANLREIWFWPDKLHKFENKWKTIPQKTQKLKLWHYKNIYKLWDLEENYFGSQHMTEA